MASSPTSCKLASLLVHSFNEYYRALLSATHSLSTGASAVNQTDKVLIFVELERQQHMWGSSSHSSKEASVAALGEGESGTG